MKRTNKEIAKDVILGYFYKMSVDDLINGAGVNEVFLIKSDDKVLLEHIKALKNIFEKAIEEIENDNT